jgi:mannose PTS system EIID component
MTHPLPAATRLSMLLRSLALQASFNYRNLIGTGFAFVMLPALRHLYGERTPDLLAAVRRHEQPFNSHPYLIGVAAGAVTRMESDGAGPDMIERFKSALRGPLGSLGDGLFWAGLRPLCLLLALLALYLGAPWWLAVLAFLFPYNIGHILARAWAFHTGFEHGAAVATGLRTAPLARLVRIFATAGAFLLGLLLPLVITGAPAAGSLPSLAIAATLFGALLGVSLGDRVRPAAAITLSAATITGLLLGGIL